MARQVYYYLHYVLAACAVCLALSVSAVAATTVADHLPVPVVEFAGLWLRATQELLDTIRGTVLSIPAWVTPWTVVIGVATAVLLYYGYQFFWAPMDRTLLLGDTGYIEEGKMSKKDIVNMVRRQRQVGECPPVYPNGWFSVLESRDLAVGQVKNVNVLGLSLAVFRGEGGNAHVTDAYCPHLGANLAVGGQVIGDCIECPFHGWKFRGDDGKCTHIPTTDKVPSLANVKAYNTLEQNGFIYIWHHAEGAEPSWTPPVLEEIASGEWSYFGRTEHEVNAHIEEVPENGADLAHLGHLHKPLITAGTDLRYMWNKLWDFGRHEWCGGWAQDPDNKHIGALQLTHGLRLFGMHMKFLDMTVTASQIGPGIVYLTFNTLFGRGAYLQSLTPREPLVQRMIHHVYMDWWVPPVIAKFFLMAEAMMVERDIMIWNHKRYARKPLLVRSAEDQLLSTHRRWYSQFYSENSPTLSFKKDTTDW